MLLDIITSKTFIALVIGGLTAYALFAGPSGLLPGGECGSGMVRWDC